MKSKPSKSVARAIVLAVGLSGLAGLAQAQSTPVFTCIGGTTPGALSGAAIGDVFNTRAVSTSTTPIQPGNQAHWEWLNAAPTGATPPAAIPGGA
jgi:hypothetical protein